MVYSKRAGISIFLFFRHSQKIIDLIKIRKINSLVLLHPQKFNKRKIQIKILTRESPGYISFFKTLINHICLKSGSTLMQFLLPYLISKRTDLIYYNLPHPKSRLILLLWLHTWIPHSNPLEYKHKWSPTVLVLLWHIH